MPIAMIAPESMLEKRDAPYVQRLCEAGFEVRYPDDPTFTRGRDEDETIRVLKDVSAVLAGGERMTARVIESLPDLRVVARSGVGYDRVDIAAATAGGVVVTITPNSNHESVAEHALTLMLAVMRNLVHQDRIARRGEWQAPDSRPMRGMTLGLVGLGRIGRSTAVRAKAFRMNVIATDPDADQQFAREHDIELVELDQLLSRSDIVSIHAPLNDATRGLFNRDRFRRMKPESVLINTARGQLVVEADLVDALQSGPLSAAGLDVYETEPLEAGNPLLKLENVVLTPHTSAQEPLANMEMGMEAAQAIVDLYQGRWPEGCVVNSELRDNWQWQAER